MKTCVHVESDEGLSGRFAPFGILPKRVATEILRDSLVDVDNLSYVLSVQPSNHQVFFWTKSVACC